MTVDKCWIGVDPGLSGAVAIITADSAIVLDFESPGTLQYLRGLHSPMCKAVIERVSARPGEGVSSSFKFGANFGQWIGRLEVLRIPFDFVTPQKWRKAMFDSVPPAKDPRARKAASIDRALRLFPLMADFLKRKKDHNRADAILLAEFCRRVDK